MTKPQIRAKALFAALVFALVFIVLWRECNLALHKPFWGDEGFDLLNTCPSAYGSTLFEGVSGQCSRAPLFYIFQRLINVNLSHLDQNILIWYRGMSLASSGLCLIVFLFSMEWLLGAASALVGFVMFINQPIYHQFAAEARPYMMWIFTFTALLCSSSYIASKKSSAHTGLAKLVFGLSALSLTMTTSPGMIQVFGVFVSFVLCWTIFDKFKPLKPKEVFKNYFILMAGAACFIGLRYALSSCDLKDMDEYDLLNTRNFGLLSYVLELLWPPGSLITIVFNLLFLLGLAVPLLLWRSRQRLSRADRVRFSLGVNIVLQLLATVVIMLLVTFKHHYFIQRVFIYLLACRSLAVALGFSYFAAVLVKKFPKMQWTLLPGVLTLVGAYLLHLDRVVFLHADYKTFAYAKDDASCTHQLDGTLRAYFVPSKHSLEFSMNFYAGLGYEMSHCGWSPSSKTHYIVPRSGGQFRPMDYQIFDSIPAVAKLEPMLQCGREIVLTPK